MPATALRTVAVGLASEISRSWGSVGVRAKIRRIQLEGTRVGSGLRPRVSVAFCSLTVFGERAEEALGYLIQAVLASCPCPLIGKGQLGAPESKPQAIPRACLDLTTWSPHLLGTMAILGARSVPFTFPASALGQSLLQAHNTGATATQCPLLMSLSLSPH